jgi:hypothetical protein
MRRNDQATSDPPRHDPLPVSLPPRGLSRDESARYLGIGVTLFDELVAEGKLPKPKHIRSRRVWDRHKLDLSFDVLAEEETAPDGDINEWDTLTSGQKGKT